MRRAEVQARQGGLQTCFLSFLLHGLSCVDYVKLFEGGCRQLDCCRDGMPPCQASCKKRYLKGLVWLCEVRGDQAFTVLAKSFAMLAVNLLSSQALGGCHQPFVEAGDLELLAFAFLLSCASNQLFRAFWLSRACVGRFHG